MNGIEVRPAAPDDATVLAALAERTFREAYGAVTAPGDLERHLAASFSPARQAAELAEGVAAFIAEADGGPVGYVQVREAPAPACVRGARPIQLWRCYVAGPWQGRHAAQALVEAALGEAARRGADTMWLTVWERADRARAFYRKAGFTEVGETEFVVGSDRQRDKVMARPIPETPTERRQG